MRAIEQIARTMGIAEREARKACNLRMSAHVRHAMTLQRSKETVKPVNNPGSVAIREAAPIVRATSDPPILVDPPASRLRRHPGGP